MKFDRRFARRASIWIGLAVAVFFVNLQLQSYLGRKALEETGLEIHGLEDGLALAAAQDKPVLANMSAIWCSSCRTFDSKVLADSSVRAEIERDYVFVRIEYDSDEGESFRERYGVKGFPVTLVLEPDGELVKQVPTVYEPGTFLGEL